jgi:23S rRNA (guanosine2251-2'-O)-methyltransferase
MIWIYGRHAVLSALENPKRFVAKVLISHHLKDGDEIRAQYPKARFEFMTSDVFASKFGPDAVHQGIALETEPLAAPTLEDIIAAHQDAPSSLVVLLDQVTDPHNVGAITRSAAAFGAHALVMPKNQSAPLESAILAKTACGGIEHVPILTVTNLSRSLEQLKKGGYWCIGLDERGDQPIHKAPLQGKIALVLGAEGDGLRRLTKENCDILTHLPTNSAFPTLNVSNAAALAFYEFSRQNSL